MSGDAHADPGWGVQARTVALALLGAGVLVLKSGYDGPFGDVVHAYAGDIAVSFAVYFVALNATWRLPRARLLAALLALLAVELFEVTDGFGVMANTYDPLDLVANAIGVGVAVVVDLATAPLIVRRGTS